MKKILVLILSFQFILVPVFAQTNDSGFIRADDLNSGAQGNIFVSGKRPGGVLIKVNLWGAVTKSGIHYVPHETDFVSLLSYAGGPSSNANLKDAYIKRRTRDAEEIIPVNIRDIVELNSSHNPTIMPNDIVVIPEIEPTIGQNTVLTVGFVSTVLSIILASFVLSKEFADD